MSAPDPSRTGRLIAPAAVYVAAVWAAPLAYAFWLSLTDTPTYGTGGGFVGFANYREIATDGAFWNAVRVTLLFCAASVSLHLAAGFWAAHAIFSSGRWRPVLQAIVLAPWTVAEIAVALAWAWMFEPNSGLLNLALGRLGADPVPWLSSPRLALTSLLIAHLWRGLALSTVIQLAGLQSIPAHIEDAARLDGAGPFSIAVRVRLPLMKPVIAAAGALTALQSLTVFALPYALTGGGPLFSTELLPVYLYRCAFTDGRLAYAAAIGIVLAFAFAGSAALLRRRNGGRHAA